MIQRSVCKVANRRPFLLVQPSENSHTLLVAVESGSNKKKRPEGRSKRHCFLVAETVTGFVFRFAVPGIGSGKTVEPDARVITF